MIFIFLAFLTLSFTLPLNAVENESVSDNLLDKKNLVDLPERSRLETDMNIKDSFINCILFCFPCFFRNNSSYHEPNERDCFLVNKKDKTEKILFRDIITLIADFLDFPTQLKLSHVSIDLRETINDNFWERQIIKQEYLLWDTSLPRAKIFFSKYFKKDLVGTQIFLKK